MKIGELKAAMFITSALIFVIIFTAILIRTCLIK